jgi:hypothetical protein
MLALYHNVLALYVKICNDQLKVLGQEVKKYLVITTSRFNIANMMW